MKRGTPDHWKMKHLARRLQIPERYAIPCANGIMERLWHYTAKFHPQGDIGASPDWAIADACGWDCGKRADRVGIDGSKALAFIDALVDSKWLDRGIAVTVGRRSGDGPLPQAGSEVVVISRLLVHDWVEHADSSVRSLLKNRKLEFFYPSTIENVAALPLPLPLPAAGEPFTKETVPSEPKRKCGNSLQVIDSEIAAVAQRIYDRHPSERRCSVPAIVKDLGTIVRTGRAEALGSGKAEILAAIDLNHASHCASFDWQKENCQYASGLANWLSPTKLRYLHRAPVSKPHRPEVQKNSAEALGGALALDFEKGYMS